MPPHSIRLIVATLSFLLLLRAPIIAGEFDAKEKAATKKVLELEGQIFEEDGKVVQIMLGHKRKPRLDAYTDVDLESIDFAAFAHLTGLSINASFANPYTDRSLAHLMKMRSQLLDLQIVGARITDAGVEKLLEKQRSLRNLVFFQTPITDKSLRRIAALEDLRLLALIGTKITDAGLIDISEMDLLISLNLSQTAITDVGLQSVKKMTGLIGVDLIGTKVTDAGILELAVLPNLRDLSVSNTRVTEKGKNTLQKLMPDLNFTK